MINSSTEKKNHISSVLNDKPLGWLFPILETGEAVCKSFFKLNESFFNCGEYLNTVPGHILTYAINKQIKSQCQLGTSPFVLVNEVINQRNGYTIPLLKKEDITISLVRGQQRGKLENAERKYLQQKCANNAQLDGQIGFLEGYNENASGMHGVLLYGAKKDWNGIEFADIVFFDEKLKGSYHSINLMERLRVYESQRTIEEKEKTLLNAGKLIKNLKEAEG